MVAVTFPFSFPNRCIQWADIYYSYHILPSQLRTCVMLPCKNQPRKLFIIYFCCYSNPSGFQPLTLFKLCFAKHFSRRTFWMWLGKDWSNCYATRKILQLLLRYFFQDHWVWQTGKTFKYLCVTRFKLQIVIESSCTFVKSDYAKSLHCYWKLWAFFEVFLNKLSFLLSPFIRIVDE